MSHDQWLTYEEAAKVLGIKAASVKRRAAARKWPKTLGNDGKARVMIAGDITPAITSDDPPTVTPSVTPDLAAALAVAEARLADAQTAMRDLRDDRDKWRAHAEMLAAKRSFWDWFRR